MKCTAYIALKFDFEVPSADPPVPDGQPWDLTEEEWARKQIELQAATEVVQAAVAELKDGPVDLAEFLTKRDHGRIEYRSEAHV